ncbi:MAG TPA: Era-like GTP-binding protein, partial [Vampirovibrionales bacterium]
MSQAPKTPNPTPSTANLNGSNRQDVQYMNRARASIRQAQSFYSQQRRSRQQAMDVKQLAAMQAQLDRLSATLERLDGGMIRIAAFGLVSRGKSTVLNTLMGQKILTTGPIHGVTQWPRSVQWDVGGNLAVELIDTPGLDEVEGQVRSEMARNIARAADLILFVVSGDITRTEYEALCELRRTQKPLILVFNKIDLYPEQDRQAIYRQLQYFASAKQKRKQAAVESEDDWVEVDETPGDRLPHQEDIVMVAADPAPLQVRIEWPDGRVSYELETPPPQIEELK